MQDTLSVAVRTFITITSLVAVPLVAVLGVSHPQTAQWLDRIRPDGPARASMAAQPQGGSDATAAAAERQTAPIAGAAPAWAEPAGAAREASVPHRDPADGPQSDALVRQSVEVRAAPPPRRQVPVFWPDDPVDALHVGAPPQLGAAQSASFEQHATTEAGSSPSAVVEDSAANALIENVPQRAGAEGAAVTSDEPAALGEAAEPFAQLAERLRTLGATHYRLETWGADGRLFRCRCLMTVPGRPHQTRYFEAVEDQPLEAMARVLDQVEPWHAQRTAALERRGPRASSLR